MRDIFIVVFEQFFLEEVRGRRKVLTKIDFFRFMRILILGFCLRVKRNFC